MATTTLHIIKEKICRKKLVKLTNLTHNSPKNSIRPHHNKKRYLMECLEEISSLLAFNLFSIFYIKFVCNLFLICQLLLSICVLHKTIIKKTIVFMLLLIYSNKIFGVIIKYFTRKSSDFWHIWLLYLPLASYYYQHIEISVVSKSIFL